MIIQNNFELSQVLWYRIGGKARYFLEVDNRADIIKALEFVSKKKLPRIFICGLGSNLIFTDDYFDGAVIRVAEPSNNKHKGYLKKNEFITAFAGSTIESLIHYSFSHNLTGLEWAGGLPGTVGAGIRGNVGAFGREINELLTSIEVLDIRDKEFNIRTFMHSDLHFSYRSSLIKENQKLLILSAKFKLHPATQKSLKQGRATYLDNIVYRRQHHPIEYPTCGSVFKNISQKNKLQKIFRLWPEIEEISRNKWHNKVPMGYIIKRLGFSGYRIGNMQVSEKHCNFITNLGHAKSEDVILIIREIQEKVNDLFGFKPEIEVEIVSNELIV